MSDGDDLDDWGRPSKGARDAVRQQQEREQAIAKSLDQRLSSMVKREIANQVRMLRARVDPFSWLLLVYVVCLWVGLGVFVLRYLASGMRP